MPPQFPSPFTALSMLLLFKQRRVELTHQDFDLHFDTLVEVLEEVDNEKYRCEEERK